MKKVLIGNRGEIAVRASLACRDIGLPYVVVYTDQDCMSEHVIQAEESYCLGGNAKEYLNGDRLLEVCKETGTSLYAFRMGLILNSIHMLLVFHHCRSQCGVSWLWFPV